MLLERLSAGLALPVTLEEPLLKEEVDGMPTFMESIKDVHAAGYVKHVLANAQITYAQATDRELCDLRGDQLGLDFVAALMKYMAQDDPPFFSDFAGKCSHKDQKMAVPYAKYSVLLHGALRKLEPFQERVVFRGSRRCLAHLYSPGQVLTWDAPCSATASVEVILGRRLLGTPSKGTMFVIELTQLQAREISRYSVFPEEREVVLPAGSTFAVTSVTPRGEWALVLLKELEPNRPS